MGEGGRRYSALNIDPLLGTWESVVFMGYSSDFYAAFGMFYTWDMEYTFTPVYLFTNVY